jgi:hypothetical protein
MSNEKFFRDDFGGVQDIRQRRLSNKSNDAIKTSTKSYKKKY